MGGVSIAGLRPGLGLGGRTHVLFMDIVGALTEPGMGARGLLMAKGVAGVRTTEESVAVGEVPIDEDIGWECATWYGCMTGKVVF